MSDSKKNLAAIGAARERWKRSVIAVIAASRDDADMTQDELARRLGWTRAQVANIELGRREIQVVDLLMITEVLGIQPDSMIRLIVQWHEQMARRRK